jgi:hypothetical protein
MRAVLYRDAIEYHNSNDKEATFIIQQIVTKDALLCKNDPIYHAIVVPDDIIMTDFDDKALDLLDAPIITTQEEPAE